MLQSNQIKGHILAFLTVFVWGSTFISTKVLLNEFHPVEILLIRFLIGWIVLWLMKPVRFPIKDKKLEFYLCMAGLTGVCLNYFFENTALVYIQAADLSVIVATAPFCVGILAHFFLKKKISKYFYIGFLISFLGVFLISFKDGFQMSFNLIGYLCGIAVSLVWAVYSVFTEKLVSYEIHQVLLTRRMFFYGIFFTFIMSLLYDLHPAYQALTKPENIMNFLYLGVVACALSFLLWNRATALLGTVSVNLYFYIQPVITIVLGMLILGETMNAQAWIGTVLTLAGLILSEK